jgi:hypothetical protein
MTQIVIQKSLKNIYLIGADILFDGYLIEISIFLGASFI